MCSGALSIIRQVFVGKQKKNPFNISSEIEYAPTAQSTVNKIDRFYCILDNIKAQCKSQEIKIVMENLNAEVGTERAGEI